MKNGNQTLSFLVFPVTLSTDSCLFLPFFNVHVFFQSIHVQTLIILHPVILQASLA